MRISVVGTGIAVAVALIPATASAASREVRALRAELAAAKAEIAAQDARIRAIEARLPAIETAIVTPPVTTPLANQTLPADGATGASEIALAPSNPAPPVSPQIETVGAAPDELERPPAVAVLGDQGAVITRRGQLTFEAQFEYARADRNRALFRGIELVESVLVGTFDINESRQDVLTASAMIRYGITSRLEIGVRAPFVSRNDASVLAPVAGSTPNDAASTVDNSARGAGLGDVELSLRYQLTDARAGQPFLIGNLQVVAPTGSNPFEVPRDSSGRELRAATGAGFWGVSPSVTAILPTDPAVLFGTIGYTRNFGASVDTVIPPVRITYVKPGDSVSLTAGIGIALNQRTSFNLGYAHTWAFGTRTRSVLLMPPAGDDGVREAKARDLQIGRFLFGVTYRMTERASLNWAVEVGATDDATDLRTVLRIPIEVFSGH